MKNFRVVLSVSALLTLLLAVETQGNDPVPTKSPPKIVFLNVGKIFQDCARVKDFQKDAQGKAGEQDTSEKARKLRERWSKALADPDLTPDELNFYLKKLGRFKSPLANLPEKVSAELFKDLAKAVEDYVAANGSPAALAYVEPADGDRLSIENLMRKVQGMDMGGGIVPFYIHPKADVTQQILDLMNRAYAKKTGVKEGK